MRIRNAEFADLSELTALWRIAFADDSQEHVDWFFGERFSPERGLVLVEDGRIASCMYLLPYRVRLRGVEKNAPFVVGAATLPQARGKGLMAELLGEAYRRLHESGESLSMLYPFRYGFYRRLGYETVSAQLVYTLPRKTLRELTESVVRDGSLKTLPLDAASLKTVYDDMTARFDTTMVRSARLCHERVDEWTRDHLPSLLCAEEGKGGPQAYALYAIEDDELSVSELAYLNANALLFLLSRLGEVMDERGISSIAFPMPTDEPVDHLLADARGLARYDPFAMLRVLDVVRLLDGLALPESEPFALRVTDPVCPWVDGVYAVGPSRHTRCARISGGRHDASCTVNTLAQLACGSLGGREARALGLLAGSERAANAFSRQKNLCFDMY